ncbi:hypothetical protein V6N13_101395 [Hibiscus sabdariffa]
MSYVGKKWQISDSPGTPRRVLEVKLWGVFIGLRCAWDMGAQWVVIETDGIEVVSLLQQRSTSRANLTILAHVLNWYNLVGTFEFNISLAQAILLQTDWRSWL